MSDQLQNPEPADERTVANDAVALGKHMASILKAILFIAPLVTVLLIIVLSLLGPAIGNIFSNITSSL